MVRFTEAILFAATVLVCVGCGGDEAGNGNTPDTPGLRRWEKPLVDNEKPPAKDSTESVLARYELNPDPNFGSMMPASLHSVAGVALNSNGELMAHNDAVGAIHRVDAASGLVNATFTLDDPPMKGVFGDIAIAGDRFFLVSNSGELYEFTQGLDSGHVQYKRHRTSLSGNNNVTGLCYDPVTSALFFLCGGEPGRGYDKATQRAVYTMSLATMELAPAPRFVLDVKDICSRLGIKRFTPTAIARHPESGSFLILSSDQPAIVEVTPQGTLLAEKKLSPAVHAGPQAMAIDRDGTIVIANEGGKLRTHMSD